MRRFRSATVLGHTFWYFARRISAWRYVHLCACAFYSTTRDGVTFTFHVTLCCAVPTLMFTTLYRHRNAIKKLGSEVQQHNRRSNSGINAAQFAKSKHARQSFVALTSEMQWLLPRFDKFKHTQYHAGVRLLVLRLLKTSLMPLVRDQFAQASIMSLITLMSISMQHEYSPYRRDSDNQVALLSQWLIFAWVFVLMLRIHGMFQEEVAAATVGALLCIATVAVLGIALVLANQDRLNEQRAERSNSSSGEDNENEEEEPSAHDVEVEAGPPTSGLTYPRETDKDKEPNTEHSSSTMWSLWDIGNGALCGAPLQASSENHDMMTIATGHPNFDELADLAIAAGVDRSEVSRLACGRSNHQPPCVS